jgi:hypothetical protein
MNDPSIPLAWSECVADSRLGKGVQYAEEDRMGVCLTGGITWTVDGPLGSNPLFGVAETGP